MGYLGLDQTEIKDDNMFQRMFWPSDHAGETDQLGKQGLWVCFAVAVLSALVLTAQSHWVLALLTLLFFALGGVGVREHSTAAATLVAVTYLLNLVANLFLALPPGILQMGATVLLLANIRGTWIAAKWARSGDPDAMPERRKETFSDRVVDQIPAKVWPITRIPFFVLGGLYVLLTLFGAFNLATHHIAPTTEQRRDTPPGATLQVSPPR